jgi:hypothetical protein
MDRAVGWGSEQEQLASSADATAALRSSGNGRWGDQSQHRDTAMRAVSRVATAGQPALLSASAARAQGHARLWPAVVRGPGGPVVGPHRRASVVPPERTAPGLLE